MAPTPVYATGFEHAITPVTTGGGLADLVSVGAGTTMGIGTGRSPSVSCLSLTRNGTVGVEWRKNLGTGTVVVISFYVKFGTISPANKAKIAEINGTTANLRLMLDTTNKLQMRCNGGVYIDGPTVTTGVWYKVEAKGDFTGTTWTGAWRVDNVEQTGDSGAAAGSDTTTKSISLMLEQPSGLTYNVTADYDDLFVSQTSGDYPLGGYHVLAETTTAGAATEHVGITTTQWQTTPDFAVFTNFSSGTETTSPGLLDDLNTSDGIRMNGSGGQAGNGRWPLARVSAANHPNAHPHVVTALISVREASAGVNNATFRILSGASTSNIFNADPGWGTTWNYLILVMATNPTGSAWAYTDLDSLKFEADSTDANPAVWLGGVILEIAYPETADPVAISLERRTPRRRSIQRM